MPNNNIIPQKERLTAALDNKVLEVDFGDGEWILVATEDLTVGELTDSDIKLRLPEDDAFLGEECPECARIRQEVCEMLHLIVEGNFLLNEESTTPEQEREIKYHIHMLTETLIDFVKSGGMHDESEEA